MSKPAPAPHVPSVPALAVMGAGLPPLPDSVVSLYGWTRVHFMVNEFDCGGVVAWGCYTYDKRLMQVDTALSRGDQWHTLEHEKVHMILGDAGLNYDERKDTAATVDDEIADAIATQRMMEIFTGEACRPLAKSR